MKIKILFIALILPVLLTGCIQDYITHPVEGGDTITIIAGLPGESASASGYGTDMPDTRVGLAEEGLDVKLNWEVGDKIYLVFEEGSSWIRKGKDSVTLTSANIINEGKKASFSVTVPAAITEETFNLYMVYGATGFVDANSYDLKLPAAPWSGKTLEEVQNKDVMMLRYDAFGLSKTSPNFSVTFGHMGSLFHIALKNCSDSDLNGITKAELYSSSVIDVPQNSGNANYGAIEGGLAGVSTGTSLPFDILRRI